MFCEKLVVLKINWEDYFEIKCLFCFVRGWDVYLVYVFIGFKILCLNFCKSCLNNLVGCLYFFCFIFYKIGIYLINFWYCCYLV